MSTQENPQPATYRLRELSTEECHVLLRSKRVGRVVWCGSNGPQALPVNYVVHSDTILFRTSPDSAIAEVGRGQRAAFEVDDIDEFVETGWSVLLVGTAESFTGAGDVPNRLEDRPTPWAPGSRPLYIRIRPDGVTGRRVVNE
jgi:nitroimidazol reductase NimA-like FMN-containing flavoprotein (pyridoxamine 5'-phosphate oxidase superfamily)